jgi:hypothetical protein
VTHPELLIPKARTSVQPDEGLTNVFKSVTAPAVSQKTARSPRLAPLEYRKADPTAIPAALIQNASLAVTPRGLVPNVPSSTAALLESDHRTARLPHDAPPTYFVAEPTAVPLSLMT